MTGRKAPDLSGPRYSVLLTFTRPRSRVPPTTTPTPLTSYTPVCRNQFRSGEYSCLSIGIMLFNYDKIDTERKSSKRALLTIDREMNSWHLVVSDVRISIKPSVSKRRSPYLGLEFLMLSLSDLLA